ncbi:unnamed protein product [Symbiodinium natans]|uniref:Actin n=1 Tax=Symbiodinium natans TaxID=878477 RepID=A0A812N3U3_9DINO|nr:unnamed protein product [Symbiodinium natans]
MHHAVSKMDLGGHGLTDHMARLLQEQGHSFTTDSDQRIVRDIKEKMCYVPLDYACEVDSLNASTRSQPMTFQLPDGTPLSLGSACVSCPEALFDPSLVGKEVGLVDLISRSIQACDADVQCSLYQTILLAGGTSLLPGLPERLARDLMAAGVTQVQPKVLALENRQWSAWVGGSILADLEVFPRMCVSKEEYDEEGPVIAHRKYV